MAQSIVDIDVLMRSLRAQDYRVLAGGLSRFDHPMETSIAANAATELWDPRRQLADRYAAVIRGDQD